LLVQEATPDLARWSGRSEKVLPGRGSRLVDLNSAAKRGIMTVLACYLCTDRFLLRTLTGDLAMTEMG
jgi:hypothetical protein